MMKQISFLVFLLLILNLNQARSQNVTGKITDRKGKALKGMSVSVKNTSNNTKTLKDGTFSLTGVTEKDTLVIRPTKNKEVYIPVTNNHAFDITVNKNDLSVASDNYKEILAFLHIAKVRANPNLLTKEQIERSNANTIADLLRGNIPGVQVMIIDNNTVAVIRGASSFSTDIEPLFLVDKVQYTSLNEVDASVNVKDIESLEVIKDGSMYGVKGANGVILITTKTH